MDQRLGFDRHTKLSTCPFSLLNIFKVTQLIPMKHLFQCFTYPILHKMFVISWLLANFPRVFRCLRKVLFM